MASINSKRRAIKTGPASSSGSGSVAVRRSSGAAVPAATSLNFAGRSLSAAQGAAGEALIVANPERFARGFRVTNGAIEQAGLPNLARASTGTVIPSMLWEPANGALPGTQTNCAAAVDRNYVCRSRFGSVTLTASGAGNVSAAWTGLNINFATAVADGYTAGVFYLYLPHLTETLTITLTNGARQRILSWNWAVGRQGWVALPFALPGLSAAMQTSVVNALVQQNISTMSQFNGGFDVNNTVVTGITISASTFGMAGTAINAGDVYAVAGIDVLPKVKPAVMITYDKVNGSGDDAFDKLVDLHVARGLKGAVRYHGIYDNNAAGLNFIKYAVDRGFDVLNGTLTRQPTSGWTVADAYREFALNDAQARASGLMMSPWATVPGNATWTAGTFEQVCASIGVRYLRGSGLSIVPHGFGGVCQPLSLGTCGLGNPIGPSGAITTAEWLQGLVDAGVHGSTFSHGFYVGANPNDSRQTQASLVAALDTIAQFQAEGKIEVVGCNRMADILDGIA